MLLTKEVILERIDEDIEQEVKNMTLSKKYGMGTAIEEKKIMNLLIVKNYMESLEDTTEVQEDKDLSYNNLKNV